MIGEAVGVAIGGGGITIRRGMGCGVSGKGLGKDGNFLSSCDDHLRWAFHVVL